MEVHDRMSAEAATAAALVALGEPVSDALQQVCAVHGCMWVDACMWGWAVGVGRAAEQKGGGRHVEVGG